MQQSLWDDNKTALAGRPLTVGAGPRAPGPAVVLETPPAEVWLAEQRVTGRVEGLRARAGVLRVNRRAWPFVVDADGRFALTVCLRDRVNRLVASVGQGGCVHESAPVELTLGYALRPEVQALAEPAGRFVRLRARVLENPRAERLRFVWSADPRNPAPVSMPETVGPDLWVGLGDAAPAGEYYFDLRVERPGGEPVRARTLVTVSPDGAVAPFDIRTDRAAWFERAVLYQITPYTFVAHGRLADVTAKIDELARLGVNTLYLQPIYAAGSPGQGYDVTDFFRVRADYGDEQDLRALISAARARGLRVLLDFVPNHTAIQHPYARDVARYGARSHYARFYQDEPGGDRYAAHCRDLPDGEARFVHYFTWQNLPNLDVTEPEVVR